MTTKGDKSGLTPQQGKAIKALLEKRTIEAAAESAGVTTRTIYRYLQTPAFRAALSQAEGDLIDQATRQLVQLQDHATRVIALVMMDSANPASVRLRAAQTVVDSLIKMRELRTVEERLTALEKAVNNGKHR